jgi:hypothetical protein
MVVRPADAATLGGIEPRTVLMRTGGVSNLPARFTLRGLSDPWLCQHRTSRLGLQDLTTEWGKNWDETPFTAFEGEARKAPIRAVVPLIHPDALGALHLELEFGGRNPAIHPDVAVLSRHVIAARFEKPLLYGKPCFFIDPEVNL